MADKTIPILRPGTIMGLDSDTITAESMVVHYEVIKQTNHLFIVTVTLGNGITYSDQWHVDNGKATHNPRWSHFQTNPSFEASGWVLV